MSDADGAEPKSENPAPKAKGKRGLGWIGTLLLLLIVGGAAAGAAYYLRIPVVSERLDTLEQRLAAVEATAGTDRDLRTDLNALDTRIGRMEDRVQRLETAAGAPRRAATSAPDPRVGQLMSRMDALENTLSADLITRLNAVPSQEELDGITSRLSALEEANSGTMLRRAANILAFTELSHAASGTQPFTAELEAAAATAPNDPAIQTLRRYAREGAPTPSQLRAEFPPLARAALEDERGGEADGIVAQLWNRLMRFVSIRRIGNVEGDDSAAIIARAETALDDENLSGAVAEIDTLQGPAADRFATWLHCAEARLAIDGATAGINSHVVRILADRNQADQSTVPPNP